jgi:hypothetical protein
VFRSLLADCNTRRSLLADCTTREYRARANVTERLLTLSQCFKSNSQGSAPDEMSGMGPLLASSQLVSLVANLVRRNDRLQQLRPNQNLLLRC